MLALGLFSYQIIIFFKFLVAPMIIQFIPELYPAKFVSC